MREKVISEEHASIAESNGISYQNVYQRIHDSGWEIENAITIPIGKREKPSLYAQYKESVERNNVSRKTFWHRTKKLGWSAEKAANTPPNPSKRRGMK